MFDAPFRLGQRLYGYACDAELPVEWTLLERARPARRSDAPSIWRRLTDRFRGRADQPA
jgi:hypothetical protein